MQCKDIPDIPILELLRDQYPQWCTHWCDVDVTWSLEHAMPKDTPGKLRLAKMRMLLRRQLVDGCGCGCRGDWVITPKGLDYLIKGKNNDESKKI